ncbi:MAG: gliding motility-associated C-terminal domain-containing protein [Elusimicrobia bacterium]|nr:gliding motility-associated C-terminal domain-containing protein [Elusimicrobiota bacterium]
MSLVSLAFLTGPPFLQASSTDAVALTVVVRPPPDGISDLRALTGDQITPAPALEGALSLAWTDPDPNDGTGTASSYDVRVATSGNLESDADFDVAPSHVQTWAPAPAGSAAVQLITGLEPGATYYWAIKASNHFGERGGWTRGGPADGVNDNNFAAASDLPPPPPSGLTALPGDREVLLHWNPVAVSDLAFYRIDVDATAPYDFFDAFSLAVGSATVSFLHTGLVNGTTYTYRLVSVDKGAPLYAGIALPGAPSSSLFAIPVPPPDLIFPNPLAGVWGEILSGSPNQIRVHWSRVLRNVDGSPAADLAGYDLFQSTGRWGPWLPLVSLGINMFSFDTPLDGSPALAYFRVVARDTSGNPSSDSALMEVRGDGTDLRLLFISDDPTSYFSLTDTLARNLLRTHTGLSEDLVLEGLRQTSREGPDTVKSVQFQVLEGYGGGILNNFVFLPPEALVVIGYPVSGGEIRPGIPEYSAADVLGLFWFNGVDFTRVRAEVSLAEKTMVHRGGRVGLFEIHLAGPVEGTALVLVRPRVFTPNGDGWNDQVVFEIQNPNRATISGKVFDARGTLAAPLAPGPTPDTLIWDGKLDGHTAPGGVYVYEISVSGRTMTGTVVVMR